MRYRTTALVVLALVTAGCGVGTDEAPRTIAAADVDYDLLGPSTTTTTAPVATVTETVYLIRGDRLSPELREVPVPADVANRLESLLGPVTPEEAGRDLRSSIPPKTRLISPPVVDGDLVRLDLSEELFNVQGDSLKRALAQIVYTATEAEVEGRSLSRVAISVDGTTRPVPDGNGVNKPSVGRVDYINIGRRG